MRSQWLSALVLLIGSCAHGPAVYDAADSSLSLTPEIETRRLAPSARPRTLRIVTYNVHFGADVAGIARSFRADAVLRTADLILVQEIQSYPQEGSSRAKRLAAALDLNYVYAPARRTLSEGDSQGTHGLALLSRYPIVAATILPLRPLRVGGSVERRIALLAVVDVAGQLLRIYNVHLDTRINARERIAQLAAVVIAAQRGGDGPAVIGGDFNSNSFFWAGQTMPVFYSNQPRALDEYMHQEGFDTPTAAIGRTMTLSILQLRLDALYVRGLQARQVGVRKSVRDSDHLPLWADFISP